MRRTSKLPLSGSLAGLLFGAYRRRILGLLLLHPGESYHVREIARLTGVSVGSLHRELTTLAKAGLLKRSSLGNQVRYTADRKCPIYAELSGIFRKTSGVADVLRDAFAPMADSIELALIFGSIAAGKEESGSDVDVLVVGAISFVKVVKVLSAVHDQLRREVNPVVMTLTEFKSKLKRRDRFLLRIAREDKIALIGDLNDIAEFAEDRAA